jgi:plasmid maintenance system killer protein
MGYVPLMIRSFKGKFAEPILQRRRVPKGFPTGLAKVARRKLIMLDAAAFVEALNSPPATALKLLRAAWRVSIQSASMINGGSCSGGLMRVPKT